MSIMSTVVSVKELDGYTLLSKQLYKERLVLGFKVGYYVLEGIVLDTDEGERVTYGLCVEKMPGGASGEAVESKVAEDITGTYEKIVGYAELMSEGEVTPATFMDIVEDLLAG